MHRLNSRKSNYNKKIYLKTKNIYSRQVYQNRIFNNLKTNPNELFEWDDRRFEIVGLGWPTHRLHN